MTSVASTSPHVYVPASPLFGLGLAKLRPYNSRVSTDKEYAEEILNRLEQIAEAKGTTVRAACVKAGIAADTVWKAQNRGGIPSIINIRKIADALGVPLGHIFGYDEPGLPTEEEMTGALEPLLVSLDVPLESIPAISRILLATLQAGQGAEETERSPGLYKHLARALWIQSQPR
jgi:transcriptional regulator with XRE-family HTH domain